MIHMFVTLIMVTQCIHMPKLTKRASLVAQWVKNPLEKGKATHSSILAWRIQGKEHPSGLQSIGLPRIFKKNAINYATYLGK